MSKIGLLKWFTATLKQFINNIKEFLITITTAQRRQRKTNTNRTKKVTWPWIGHIYHGEATVGTQTQTDVIHFWTAPHLGFEERNCMWTHTQSAKLHF